MNETDHNWATEAINLSCPTLVNLLEIKLQIKNHPSTPSVACADHLTCASFLTALMVSSPELGSIPCIRQHSVPRHSCYNNGYGTPLQRQIPWYAVHIRARRVGKAAHLPKNRKLWRSSKIPGTWSVSEFDSAGFGRPFKKVDISNAPLASVAYLFSSTSVPQSSTWCSLAL